MRIKPVLIYAKPEYPDKYEIELNRALLYHHPKRWVKEPLVGLTLATLIAASLTGCSAFGRTAGTPSPSGLYNISDDDALSIIANELETVGYRFVKGGDKDDFEFDAQVIADDHRINIEYVSCEDFAEKKYPDLAVYSSDSCYTKEVADELKGIYEDAAIFYTGAYSENGQQDLQYAEAELRAQVLDFIEWLQSIGMEG